MIVVDIFIALFVVALVVIGGPYLVQRFMLSNPKRKEIEAAQVADEQGELNTVRLSLTELRRCVVCRNLTDPDQDLKPTGSWIHYDCYMQQHKDKKNNA